MWLTMKLDDYQTGAIRTAIYPASLTYPALGLCGEIGELTKARGDNVSKEIGDCLWYVANTAHDANLSMSEVCERKAFSDIRLASIFCGDKALRRKSVNSLWTCELHEMIWIQAGVVAENVKKTIRDDDGSLQEARRENIRLALKQIVVGLSAIARKYDLNLKTCAEMNLDKLRSREERGKLKGDGDER